MSLLTAVLIGAAVLALLVVSLIVWGLQKMRQMERRMKAAGIELPRYTEATSTRRSASDGPGTHWDYTAVGRPDLDMHYGMGSRDH